MKLAITEGYNCLTEYAHSFQDFSPQTTSLRVMLV